MQYFNFNNLISKYKSDFIALTVSDGSYNNAGDYVKGELVKTQLSGAIISHTEAKIFRSEGALTEKDKRLFMLEPIDEKLHGAKVIYEGNAYDLLTAVENSKFTGVYSYTLKYVSSFNEIAKEYGLKEGELSD